MSELFSEEAADVLISVLKAYSRPKDFLDNQRILQRIIANMFNTSATKFRVYVSDSFSIENIAPTVS